MGIDSGDEPIINVGMAERASSKFFVVGYLVVKRYPKDECNGAVVLI